MPAPEYGSNTGSTITVYRAPGFTMELPSSSNGLKDKSSIQALVQPQGEETSCDLTSVTLRACLKIWQNDLKFSVSSVCPDTMLDAPPGFFHMLEPYHACLERASSASQDLDINQDPPEDDLCGRREDPTYTGERRGQYAIERARLDWKEGAWIVEFLAVAKGLWIDESRVSRCHQPWCRMQVSLVGSLIIRQAVSTTRQLEGDPDGRLSGPASETNTRSTGESLKDSTVLADGAGGNNGARRRRRPAGPTVLITTAHAAAKFRRGFI
ncbi:hypothetical protein Micbo1qcDRAFT_174941 [Microdochium bolleyi]|uniref:Uncharacterized protein n=1 Tax=Microdochium bolleyi TaxID=196109 RepID=A0A136J4M6_9PEZI|nr:hypothetical protein Micbo1qcDRAFT_174941 [Microdochium bolleyi]